MVHFQIQIYWDPYPGSDYPNLILDAAEGLKEEFKENIRFKRAYHGSRQWSDSRQIPHPRGFYTQTNTFSTGFPHFFLLIFFWKNDFITILLLTHAICMKW